MMYQSRLFTNRFSINFNKEEKASTHISGNIEFPFGANAKPALIAVPTIEIRRTITKRIKIGEI